MRTHKFSGWAGIALLATQFTMYESSGLLFKNGLPGIGPCGEYE